MAQNPQKNELRQKIRQQIGSRITEFYSKKGLKRKEFSESIGWEYDTLRSYEEGRAEPGGDFYNKLIEVYPNSDIGYIITGIGTTAAQRKRIVSVYQDVKAGAPVLGFADEDIIAQITTNNTKDLELFALRVRGNSMEPEISEDDYIICAPGRSFISGKIYVVVTADSEATVKQVWRKDTGYELVAFNPEYRNQFYAFDQIIRLIRVVEIQRTYE